MRCRGVQGVAKPAFLGGFLCCGLLRVAPYCAPSGIRVVSNANVSLKIGRGGLSPRSADRLWGPLVLITFRWSPSASGQMPSTLRGGPYSLLGKIG
jgi:hypothetical protein